MRNPNLAIARTFDIFDLYERKRQPMTISQIARHLDVPKSSSFNLLRGLVELGLLDYTPETKLYFPTLKLATYGTWIEGALFDGRPVEQLMTELNNATKETIGLGIQRGLNVQFIEILSGQMPITLNLSPNDTAPMISSAMGLVLLSLKDDREIRTLFNAVADSDQDVDGIDLDKLLIEIETVRRQGYAQTSRQVESESCGVAIHLPIEREIRPVALAVAGPRERIQRNKEDILSAMREGIYKFFGKV